LPIPLLPSDIGSFPVAASHCAERAAGCGQLILILCVRGAGWVGLKNARYEVVPGQLVAILPNEPHEYGASERRPWTIYWCHAVGQAAERLGWRLRDASSPILEIDDQPRLVRLFEGITDELSKGYGIDHLIMASLTLAHLLGLAMASRSRHKVLSDAIRRVHLAISYMQQRHEQQISIPELAAMVNLSTSHFCALFKKVTDFPPLEYFTRLKIRRGCELLDATHMSVKRIAEELGFSDSLYFSRVFRKIHGMSPTEYRGTRKG
jgi:AraC-like DNA-binding protein